MDITEKDRIFHLPFVFDFFGNLVGYTEDSQQILHRFINL